MSPNIRIKVRVGYSLAAPPQSDSDKSSEDGMLGWASPKSLPEEAGDDVDVTMLTDSIICPRYNPCVLRYGKLPALSGHGNFSGGRRSLPGRPLGYVDRPLPLSCCTMK
jgi:hypothetical protein